jgi:hypothetical protein
MKATMRLMVKRSRTKSRRLNKARSGPGGKSANPSDVPDSCGLQAFSRRKSQRISTMAQALVNHVSQGLVNHAHRCRAGDGGLTSLFKPIRTRLWHALTQRPGIPGGETKAVRRQTATSGINPAGSSRALRLDPHSLPISFNAHDTRADGGVRRIELHRERVVVRRALHGMQMAVNVRMRDFLGVALRGVDDAQMLVLVHRDPSLAIPFCVSSDREEIASAWQMWSDIFALPQLPEDKPREPAVRRRRHNAIRARRPKFLVRRRRGGLQNLANIHQGEREIIARD